MTFNKKHPFDYAQELLTLPLQQQRDALEDLSLEDRVEVFEYLPVFNQQELIEILNDQQLNELFSELEYDSIDELIQDDESLVNRLYLSNKEMVQEILDYPTDSAGRLMLTETFTVQVNETVGEVIQRLRSEKDVYHESTLFVLDGTVLYGYFQVGDLLINQDSTSVLEFTHPILHYVQATTDQEEVMHVFSNYDLVVVAVVDSSMNYLGYITIDYIMDVMQDESDEDFEKMGAITPLEDSYLDTPTWIHVKKRITWLLVLMLSATITGALLVEYEHAFEALPLLVSFIPMLMDTGGNSGSQASTLVIRGIATNEIKLKDAWKVLNKEFKISLITAILLSIVNFVRIVLMYQDTTIALVVSLTLIATVMIAKMIGAMLPLLADRFNLDPAVMSAPLITTVVDTCSVIIYFNIAIALLKL